MERHPGLAEHGSAAAKRYAPPGGESFAAVRARVSDALDEYGRSKYGRVLVVTHAGPLHAMLHTFFGDPGAEMQEALGVRFSPAAITRVEVGGEGAQLLSLNDVTHLAHL